jgi:predicted phosphohydrolase
MSDIFHFETANHSFYHSRAQLPVNKRPPPFGITLARQQEVFKEYNIVHLDGTSYNLGENIVVLGFDGWYNETNLSQLNTNDYKFLPQFIESAPAHIYLKEKAHKDLDKLLNIPTEGKTVITMTHFPPFSESPQYLIWCANPKYMDFITEKSHFFLTGHSHRQCDFVYQGCRVLNAGVNEAILPKEARYDKPRYVIFEVEDKPLSK